MGVLGILSDGFAPTLAILKENIGRNNLQRRLQSCLLEWGEHSRENAQKLLETLKQLCACSSTTKLDCERESRASSLDSSVNGITILGSEIVYTKKSAGDLARVVALLLTECQNKWREERGCEDPAVSDNDFPIFILTHTIRCATSYNREESCIETDERDDALETFISSMEGEGFGVRLVWRRELHLSATMKMLFGGERSSDHLSATFPFPTPLDNYEGVPRDHWAKPLSHSQEFGLETVVGIAVFAQQYNHMDQNPY